MQTGQQALVFYYGSQALLMLFGYYGLYEWARILLARLTAKTLVQDRAHLLFALPAAALGLLPIVVTALWLQLAPDFPGTHQLNLIFILVGSLLGGLVVQAVASAVFWLFTRKAIVSGVVCSEKENGEPG